RQTRPDFIDHGARRHQRVAEVSGYGANDPADVTLVVGPVEPVLRVDAFYLLRRGAQPENGHCRISGQEIDEQRRPESDQEQHVEKVQQLPRDRSYQNHLFLVPTASSNLRPTTSLFGEVEVLIPHGSLFELLDSLE